MPARAAEVPGLLASPQPLATAYDVALTDLDGVVYLGASAIPGAPAALAAAVAAGLRIVYVTNNASRTPSAIAAQLAALGAPARPADVVTSAQAGARLLAERLPPGSEVLVVGGTGLRLAVRERGFRPVSVASGQTAAVIQGYAPDLSYSLLTEGALAVQAGALFVASNADLTLPTPRGRQPGNGSLLRVIATATGQEPLVAGKPEPPLHAEAVARSGARRPLVVGDRLDTDIEGAVRVGCDSLLVLTGVTRPLDLVLAPAWQRPSYLAESLAGLLAPQPGVTRDEDGFRCGGWLARPGPGQVALSGTGERLDGLRALCAAAWSGAGPAASAVAAALGQLGY
jgi:glycerol 3-phosphatase-2